VEQRLEKMTKYNTDITKVQEYLKNKSICLLGNAESIFNNKKDIDSFEIVCRCNRAFPKLYEKDFKMEQHKEYIGTRTDVLFTSAIAVGREEVESIIKPKFIIRTRKSVTNMTPWFLENSILWSEVMWSSWCVKVNFSPTTGCLALHFLMECIEFKDLTLYGFDFWKTPDHTVTIRHQKLVGHNPEKEKEYVLGLPKKYPNIKIIEDLENENK